MNSLAGFPVLAPLGAALLSLLVRCPSKGRRIALGCALFALLGFSVALLLHVRESGPLVLSWGGWFVPFGIVFVADTLACIMLSLSSLIGLFCALYGFSETPLEEEHPLRLPLLLLLLAGIHLAFLTGDLFNLFVSFEVFLLASYALMTLESSSLDSHRFLPYVTINLLGSALFLCVCAFAYGLLGTLNFAEMAERSSALVGDPRLDLLGLLLLLVFSIKAGLFPLYYWLPISYSVLPAPIAAFYASLLTKVGIYVLLRIFGTVLPPELHSLHTLIAWAAGLTMVLGVLGALAQNHVQAILSYHVVSQVGYMALAIGLFSPFAFTAAILYVIHHIVVKASLFLIGGLVSRAQGTDDLKRLGGLWTAAPGLSLFFLLQALSLAGVPPLSGFWGKLMIVQEGLRQGEGILVFLSLLASILTLVSMLKIWIGAFWRPAPQATEPRLDRTSRRSTALIGIMTALSLGIGLGAHHFVPLAGHAARETLDRTGYIERVRSLNLTPEEGKHP